MKATIAPDYEVVEAAGRATLYSLLATGLALPTAPRLSLIANTLLPCAQAFELPAPFEEELAALASCLPTNLSVCRNDHLMLFPPIMSQDAPAYETAYRGEGIFQQAALLADISGFYRAHGLRAGGREKERLDHITVQLEFMAVLARKELLSLQSGQPDNTSICRDTAALFLRDHLCCWAPAFGRRAAAVTGSPWYRSLGALIAHWVEEDTAAAGVVPIDVVEEPLPQEPPDDGSCGPCPMAEQGVG